MGNRAHRASVASETLSIIEAGGYTHGETQQPVDLREAILASKLETDMISPNSFDPMATEENDLGLETKITVANETTFAAGRRMSSQGNGRVCCLNFASAKNPGGGFLNGSQAQEEALARASGLYACLLEAEEYYRVNRECRSFLFTDLLVYSPDVPVFRDDDDQLIESPWYSSIITAPAPNAGMVRKNEPDRVDEIEPTFRRRIESVFETARHFGESQLVLGAWGCGVFRNDPAVCARLFGEVIEYPRFAGCFSHIHFAVLDGSKDEATFQAFEDEFAERGDA